MKSGATARTISKYRPSAPVIAVTRTEQVATSLCLNWGVHSVVAPSEDGIDATLAASVEVAKKYADLQSGDIAVITAGISAGIGNTNLMQIHEVE